jgi:hypothetical protein
MNLQPTKIELISLEVSQVHLLVKLLLCADACTDFDIPHHDVIDTLIMMESKFENIDKKFEEIFHANIA